MSDQNPESRASSVSSDSDSLGFFYRVRPTYLPEIDIGYGRPTQEEKKDVEIPSSLFWILENMKMGDQMLFSVERKAQGLEFLVKSMTEVESMSGVCRR
jgi:hypothetical protein